MTLQEIKEAVLAGETVHCTNNAYIVVHDTTTDRWLIKCLINNTFMGLTYSDGIIMNGKESDFYVAQGGV